MILVLYVQFLLLETIRQMYFLSECPRLTHDFLRSMTPGENVSLTNLDPGAGSQ